MKNILGLILLMTLVSCASNTPVKSLNQKKAELYYNHGTNKLMEKEYTEALDYLIKAHRFDDKDLRILNNLGMAYFFKKKAARAKYYFKKAIELKPEHSDSRNNLASVSYTTGDYKAALKQYLIVKNDLVYRKQFRTHYNIGLVYEKLGQTNKAITHLKKATKLKEDYCAALHKLGMIYRKKFHYSEALEWFENAQKGACHNEPAPLYNMALTLKDLQKYEQAQTKFKELQERFASTRYSTLANLQLRKIRAKEIISTRESYKARVQKELRKKNNSIDSPAF